MNTLAKLEKQPLTLSTSRLVRKSTKVFDIIEAKDNWERWYFKVEHWRTKLKQVGVKRIVILDGNGCRLVHGWVIHDDYCTHTDEEL